MSLRYKDSNGDIILVANVGGGNGDSSVQADWAQNDSTSLDFIKNKPNIESGKSYVENKASEPDASIEIGLESGGPEPYITLNNNSMVLHADSAGSINIASGDSRLGVTDSGVAASGSGGFDARVDESINLVSNLEDIRVEATNGDIDLITGGNAYYNGEEIATKADIESAIGEISELTFSVVEELPAEDISTSTVYLIETAESGIYEKWIFIEDDWVSLGTTAIDFSEYLTKDEAEDTYLKLSGGELSSVSDGRQIHIEGKMIQGIADQLGTKPVIGGFTFASNCEFPQLAYFLPLAGGTMTGDIWMSQSTGIDFSDTNTTRTLHIDNDEIQINVRDGGHASINASNIALTSSDAAVRLAGGSGTVYGTSVETISGTSYSCNFNISGYQIDNKYFHSGMNNFYLQTRNSANPTVVANEFGGNSSSIYMQRRTASGYPVMSLFVGWNGLKDGLFFKVGNDEVISATDTNFQIYSKSTENLLAFSISDTTQSGSIIQLFPTSKSLITQKTVFTNDQEFVTKKYVDDLVYEIEVSEGFVKNVAAEPGEAVKITVDGTAAGAPYLTLDDTSAQIYSNSTNYVDVSTTSTHIYGDDVAVIAQDQVLLTAGSDIIVSGNSESNITLKNYDLAGTNSGDINIEPAVDLNITTHGSGKALYNGTEIATLDDIVSTTSFEIVNELPTQDISTSTIYLVPQSGGTAPNIYDEYIYINNSWERIGSTTIDLSNYYTKTQADLKFVENSSEYPDEETVITYDGDAPEAAYIHLSDEDVSLRGDGGSIVLDSSAGISLNTGFSLTTGAEHIVENVEDTLLVRENYLDQNEDRITRNIISASAGDNNELTIGDVNKTTVINGDDIVFKSVEITGDEVEDVTYNRVRFDSATGTLRLENVTYDVSEEEEIINNYMTLTANGVSGSGWSVDSQGNAAFRTVTSVY